MVARGSQGFYGIAPFKKYKGSPLPHDAGLGHMACVDEKDGRKCKIRRCLTNTCMQG